MDPKRDRLVPIAEALADLSFKARLVVTKNPGWGTVLEAHTEMRSTMLRVTRFRRRS